MLDFLTNSRNINTLENSLKVSSLRHRVISNNIANVDTPFFKRSEVLFETYLKDHLDNMEKGKVVAEQTDDKLGLKTTNSRHIAPIKLPEQPPFLGAVIRTVDDLTMRTDGNNVDIDVEMADMAKNTIYYQAVAQRLNGYFSSLRTVIESR